MAMHVPKAPGFAQMMKDGARHFSGLEEAVLRNIDACKEMAKTTRSAYGPNGQNKMVINHLEKLFVTNDAATILRELEVEHPAAKMLVMASQQQEQENGDGTNFVLVFAGALLSNAEALIRMGLSVTEIIEGYEMACEKVMQVLPEITCGEIPKSALTESEERGDLIRNAIKTAVMSKQYGNEDFLADLILKACFTVLRRGQGYLNVDHIRVSKIPGLGMLNSTCLQGMVFKRYVESDVTEVKDAKVAVYTCAFDILQTETKGTILIKNAEDLKKYSEGEEHIVEEQVKAIVDAGIKVVVTGGKIGELALHYANQYGLMLVRLPSKWDLRRLCKAVNATPLPRLTPPTSNESGHCKNVNIDEIGGTSVVVFNQEMEDSSMSTIIIRGATDNIMDDVERAVDDGVNTFKTITKNGKLLPGAGATEIELAKEVHKYGESISGLEQYAIQKYAESFEALPRALAENSGVNATELISNLYAAHHEGKKNTGFNIDTGSSDVKDAFESGLVDMFLTKQWAIKYATTAACTVLLVDQIIMAKRAGGPKAPKNNPNWDED